MPCELYRMSRLYGLTVTLELHNFSYGLFRLEYAGKFGGPNQRINSCPKGLAEFTIPQSRLASTLYAVGLDNLSKQM